VPPVVADQIERVDLVIPLVSVILLGLSLPPLLAVSAIPASRYLVPAPWQNVMYGLWAGVGWLVLFALLLQTVSSARVMFAARWELRIGWFYWSTLTLLAAPIEEIWRATCLLGFEAIGTYQAVAATTLAFAVGHATPSSRVVSAALFSIYESWLFLKTESVVTTVTAHIVVNIGLFAMMRTRALNSAQQGR
jgi:hypothetical protein